jgi:hypothetical protein
VAVFEHASFSGVWGSGPDDVWAVGGSSAPHSRGAIVHWDGARWSSSILPSTEASRPAPYSLSGVWGSGPSDVWAVGAGAILHWDGGEWTTYAHPLTGADAASGLTGVWGSNVNDVWAVGWSSGGSPPYDGVGDAILHWDGTAWALASTPRTMDPLEGIWGSGSNDVWAVGGGMFQGEILHDDRVGWSVSPAPTGGGSAIYLAGVWGSGTHDVWAVGDGLWGGTLHWDGGSWAVSPSLRAIDAGETHSEFNGVEFRGVWGSAADDVWVVGSLATNPTAPVPTPLIIHWNGSVWETSPILAPDGGAWISIESVWGSGPCNVWAVSTGGDIFHYP